MGQMDQSKHSISVMVAEGSDLYINNAKTGTCLTTEILTMAINMELVLCNILLEMAKMVIQYLL